MRGFPRLFVVSWIFNVKNLTYSIFFVLISVMQPIIFASIAFFMVEAGARQGTQLYVALGAGKLQPGVWGQWVRRRWLMPVVEELALRAEAQ